MAATRRISAADLTIAELIIRYIARCGCPVHLERAGWRWSRRSRQLRHSAATRIRREFGQDVARAVLGHSSPVVTEVYAELDQIKASEAVGEISGSLGSRGKQAHGQASNDDSLENTSGASS